MLPASALLLVAAGLFPIWPAGRHTITTLWPAIDPMQYTFSSLSPTSRLTSPCFSSSITFAAASSIGSAHTHPTVYSPRCSWHGMAFGMAMRGKRRMSEWLLSLHLWKVCNDHDHDLAATATLVAIVAAPRQPCRLLQRLVAA
jgi:hypothetical protein